MLEAVSARRWSGDPEISTSNTHRKGESEETLVSGKFGGGGKVGGGGGGGRYTAAVVGSLPDSYQQFQYELSCKLAQGHPELSELLCEEIMQRQLDSVDIVAQHQVSGGRIRGIKGDYSGFSCFYGLIWVLRSMVFIG